MEDRDEARRRKETLRTRMAEARDACMVPDPAERKRQRERARLLRDMYRDACDELSRLEGRQRAEKRREVRGDGAFSGGAVWADLEGNVWGDLLTARERQSGLLLELLGDALNACTRRQRELLREYYGLGKPQTVIAEERGVNVSTVSRSIKSGLNRVGTHVAARLAIGGCFDQAGRFDYLRFCRATGVLTPKQAEVLHLALTRDAGCARIAADLGRDVSTVSRTMERIRARLREVRVELLPELDVSRNPRKADALYTPWDRTAARPESLLAALRDLARGGDELIIRVDAAALDRVKEMGPC